MKLLNPGRAEWLLRQQRQRALWEQRQAGHCFARGRTGTGRRPSRSTVVIQIPATLMAETFESRTLVLDVLASLVRHLSATDATIKLDWSKVQKIYPGGMLVLLAYLELLSEQWPRRIRIACPRGSLASQLIRHFGFGPRFGVSEVGNTPRHSSVLPWRFATGAHVDGETILDHIRGVAGHLVSEIPDGLYDALSEAATNVRQHAYPATSEVPDAMKRWWLFSKSEKATEREDGVIYLAFYDVGVGIPESMRDCLLGLREKAADLVRSVLAEFGIDDALGQDAALVRLAVEHRRTRTGLPFRGKGLPEMKEFVVGTVGGRMTIISGLAQYSVRAESPDATSVKCQRGILGTLILWSLPLKWKEAKS